MRVFFSLHLHARIELPVVGVVGAVVVATSLQMRPHRPNDRPTADEMHPKLGMPLIRAPCICRFFFLPCPAATARAHHVCLCACVRCAHDSESDCDCVILSYLSSWAKNVKQILLEFKGIKSLRMHTAKSSCASITPDRWVSIEFATWEDGKPEIKFEYCNRTHYDWNSVC